MTTTIPARQAESAPAAPPTPARRPGPRLLDEAQAGRLYTTVVVSADPSTARLSEAQVRQFREQGWLAIEGVFDAEEVETAKLALSDFIHGRIVAKDGRTHVQEEPQLALPDGTLAPETETERELRVRKVFDFTHHDARLQALTRQAGLRRMLDQLIGPHSRLIQDMALLKPPRIGTEKPWHQDTAYFDWLPLGGIIGCWIALDPATVANGCMQVIPGTHLEGPVAHFHHRDCQIADERVQVQRAVAIPLAPGGILFFSGLIHHGTPPNRSADRRRALQFHYAAADCRKMTFEEHAALFNEGGLYAGCRGWGRSDIERAAYPTP
ncbi:MAG TPA: phytanoyl-CoA dioxygenase family protein [Chloroflexota bacterium]|jgi:phytanoyl-CoA hydroxylase|nr:phytanoyl-CoA dioxygenase family protein [Chloroflexota bacterium]